MAFSQQKARDTLSLYQAVGMALGGKEKDVKAYLGILRKASGAKEAEAKTSKSKLSLGESFGSMPGILTAEQYREMVAQAQKSQQV